MILTHLVKRRLRKVAQMIRKNPSHFEMSKVLSDPSGCFEENELLDHPLSCGTTACVCGWYGYLLPKKARPKSKDLVYWLKDALGLSNSFEDGQIYNTVIEKDYWPEPFKSRFAKVKTKRAKAHIAAQRVEFLIERGI